jgi:eukaryotic-like serine/threonine-protein kinase
MGLLDSLKQMFGGGNKDGLPIIDVAKRFELVTRTGQGSMSKVWRAIDRETGRTVCLKILDREKTLKFEGRFPGLKKPSEGEISMLLKHRNLVQTFEHGWTTDKEPYLVMELIDGFGLNYLIETKHKDLQGNRVNFLAQYATGIEFMHKAGYLHRDICPRNVMVTKEDSVVKIIDLGLTIPYKPEFCKPGNRTGTTAYLAPEIIKRSSTDHRVDMFALGVTAYETFVGDLPWERGSSQEVMRAIMNNAPRNPRDFRPDLDEDAANFLLKAVKQEAKDRFQTPAEFRDALMQIGDHW